MAFRYITCPETAHLEQIEYDDSPLGMIVVGCSRFEPRCSLTCQRTCAARLDRKNQIGRELDRDRDDAFDDEEDTLVDGVCDPGR